MKKDVIYIDTEDDITAIIDKVKHADAQIVALVPPKRIGVLQSTVNLRLLQRAAGNANKRVVLITNDQALSALAAGIALPIAKNLQSKPEIASLEDTESEGSDVIDGADLPVGELAGMTADSSSKTETGTDLDDSTMNDLTIDTSPVEATDKKKVSPEKSKDTKLPNFNSFRKKLFIFGGLGILLVGFLIWAIFFAAHAKITITARTNVVNISKTLQLKPGATLDVNQAVLPVTSKQEKKTVSVDFTPTGTKNVGDKATGTVTMRTCVASFTPPASVPSGTTVTTGGNSYVTTEDASFSTGAIGNGCINYATSATNITAAQPGTSSNVSNATFAVSGRTSVTGSGSASGGTDKTVTTVSADDISKATEQLKSQDSNTIRDELAKQFDSDVIVITEAFTVDAGTPTSTPAVDQEATAAKLTVETTYTLLGIQRADLKAIYDNYLTTQLKGDTSQKVYKSGDESTQFSSFQKLADGTYTVRAIATAQVGPNLKSEDIANESKGKMIGEVQQTVGGIQGVENVDVSLSPFWVTKVPNDTSRITVTFTIQSN